MHLGKEAAEKAVTPFKIENDENFDQALPNNRMLEISIIVIVLVVISIGAFVAYRVMNKNKRNSQNY